VLNVPDGVDVRKVDLSIELQILAFHAQRRSAVRSQPYVDAEVRSLDSRTHVNVDSPGAGAQQAAVEAVST